LKTTIFVSNITYLLSNVSTLDSISLAKKHTLVGLSSLEILTILESSIWGICDYWFGKGNSDDPILNTPLATEIFSFLNTSAISVKDKLSLTHQIYILADELHLVVNYDPI